MNFRDDHDRQIELAQAGARLESIKNVITKRAMQLSMGSDQLERQRIVKVVDIYGGILFITPEGYYKRVIEDDLLLQRCLSVDEMIQFEMVDGDCISEFHAAQEAWDALNSQKLLEHDVRILLVKYGKEKIKEILEG